MTGTVVAIALGIGFVAGLRSLTAPAAVCWAAHLGWIDLAGTPLGFMGSTVALVIFSLLAVVELVMDKLPTTPSRTTAVPLTGRVLMGGLAGATLCAAAHGSLPAGALAGVVGALAGTFGGYQARVRLTRTLPVPPVVVALLEDAVAVAGGLFLASRL